MFSAAAEYKKSMLILDAEGERARDRGVRDDAAHMQLQRQENW